MNVDNTKMTDSAQRAQQSFPPIWWTAPYPLLLDRYQVTKHLESGGFNEIYEATDTKLDRRVIIRVLRRALLVQSPEEIPRMIAHVEAGIRNLLNVRLPNVPQIHERGSFTAAERNIPFVIMESIEGTKWKIPPTYAKEFHVGLLVDWLPNLQIWSELLLILNDLHGQQMFHGDVKPKNVMIQTTTSQRNLLWLIDFDLAAYAQDAVHTGQLAADGTEVAGTLGYMAPERLAGSRVTAATDIYSAGAILYQILTGQLARPDAAPLLIQQKGARCEPLMFPGFIPPEIEEVARRALSYDPEERYPSVQEFRGEFLRALNRVAQRTNFALPLPLHSGLDVPSQQTPRPKLDIKPVLSGDCAVILPPVCHDGSAAEDVFTRVFEPALREAVSSGSNMPITPFLLTYDELEAGTLDDDTFETLEYCPIQLWDIVGMDNHSGIQRLFELFSAIRGAKAIRPAGATVPAAVRSKAAVEYAMPTGTQEPDCSALRELAQNCMDSQWLPRALDEQWQIGEQVNDYVREAYQTIINGDVQTPPQGDDGAALIAWKDRTLTILESCPRAEDMPLIMLHYAYWLPRVRQNKESTFQSIQILERVTRTYLHDWAPAWRELAVCYRKIGDPIKALTCYDRALECDPYDFEALSSRSGVLKRSAANHRKQAAQDLESARHGYWLAARLSNDDPFPLLNAVRLDFMINGSIDIGAEMIPRIERAIETRAMQAPISGPDKLFCYLDMIEANLYLNNPDQAWRLFQTHEAELDGTFELKTFFDSLNDLLTLRNPPAGTERLTTRIKELLDRHSGSGV